jgi:asparagine synthetase B (glutamine-hydrolysing)
MLARDVFGGAPLYYHQGDGFVAFASSMNPLLSLDRSVKEPDMMRLAGLLVAWNPEADTTAYKGYLSVVGAHAVSVNASGQIRSWNFWSPEGRQPLGYRRHQDYADEFLQHYDCAVRSCLRTRKPVAAELSGGRDSGSVVALAAPILAQQGRDLTAFTSRNSGNGGRQCQALRHRCERLSHSSSHGSVSRYPQLSRPRSIQSFLGLGHLSVGSPYRRTHPALRASGKFHCFLGGQRIGISGIA